MDGGGGSGGAEAVNLGRGTGKEEFRGEEGL